MSRDLCMVFGSNLAGKHGAGSALEARKRWGAILGRGIGFQGVDYATPSRCSYAIPTKGRKLEVLPLLDIECHVNEFLVFARRHNEMDFKVVAIGCGLAGYSAEQIAPMFRDAPPNCCLPPEFKKVLDQA